jgi:hypothetical protein
MQQIQMFSAERGPVTGTKMQRKKTKKKTETQPARKVSRGKKLKRHPLRPPPKKRVVATKRVALQSLPDGPFGDIVETYTADAGERQVGVKWDGKGDKVYRMNPRFLIPIERTD